MVKGWIARANALERRMKPLSERMENRTGTPKSWIAEVKKLERTIKEKDEKIAEYGDIIDVLATKVEELQKDQAPFQAQIDQLKSFEVRCNYCKRTPAEAEEGYKCSTCNHGGDDETKNEIPPKVGREDVEHPHPQT